MAEIVTLRGSPHERVQQLLPWYAKGTLAAGDKAEVDLHLAQCAECREELVSERALAGAIAGLPLESERSWAAVARQLDERPQHRADFAPVSFFRRRVSAGWASGAALAAASVAALVVTAMPMRSPADHTYTALGSPRAAMSGNAVIMFTPDTSERQFRTLLSGAGARVVDGPTASGGYVLHVPDAQREATLAKLRAATSVVLAEPIDAGRSP
jgi:anti-sigma factor RsiW